MIFFEPKHAKIIKYILSNSPYTFYVFGSRTQGKNRRFSDLDLCAFHNFSDMNKERIDRDFDSSDLPFKVDLICWNKISNDYQNRIVEELTLIKQSNQLRFCKNNLCEKLLLFSQFPGLKKVEYTGIKALTSSAKTREFNIIFSADYYSDKDALDTVFKIIKSYEGKPAAWWIDLTAGCNELYQVIKANYKIKVHYQYAMLLELGKFKHTDAEEEDFQVKEVQNKREYIDFIELVKQYDPAAAVVYSGFSTNDVLEIENYKIYIGYYKDKPVCMGTSYFAKEIFGIYDLYTSPAYRMKGLGSLLLRHIISKSYSLNAVEAFVFTSNKSVQAMCEQIGFQVIGLVRSLELN